MLHFIGWEQITEDFFPDALHWRLTRCRLIHGWPNHLMNLNSQNPALASYNMRIWMALSFMSEETIRHWKMRMPDWAHPVVLADKEATWDQFVMQFRTKYANTQRGDCAWETIDSLKMKGIAIDQYILDFIWLAENADYNLNAMGTWRYFLKGLPKAVEIEVIKANQTDWPTLRQTAIDATNAWNCINIAFGNYFSFQNQCPQRPLNQNWRQNTQSTQAPCPQYNLSNAPCSYNNTHVPMNLSYSKAPRWPGPARTNIAQA